ncbi:MAG: hypothetical protein U0Y82_13140 [Thermoleophilia bacterium]
MLLVAGGGYGLANVAVRGLDDLMPHRGTEALGWVVLMEGAGTAAEPPWPGGWAHVARLAFAVVGGILAAVTLVVRGCDFGRHGQPAPTCRAALVAARGQRRVPAAGLHAWRATDRHVSAAACVVAARRASASSSRNFTQRRLPAHALGGANRHPPAPARGAYA